MVVFLRMEINDVGKLVREGWMELINAEARARRVGFCLEHR